MDNKEHVSGLPLSLMTLAMVNDIPSPSSVIDDNSTTTNTTWSSNKISNEVDGIVKMFEYTGNGNTINVITLPSTPKCILSIVCESIAETQVIQSGFLTKENIFGIGYILADSARVYSFKCSFNANVITIEGETGARAFNSTNIKHTVYYI